MLVPEVIGVDRSCYDSRAVVRLFAALHAAVFSGGALSVRAVVECEDYSAF